MKRVNVYREPLSAAAKMAGHRMKKGHAETVDDDDEDD